MSIDLSTNVFHQNPMLGLAVTTATVVVAEISKQIEAHVPPIIMELFQMGAWASAIVVGIITVHGWIKKNFVSKPEIDVS